MKSLARNLLALAIATTLVGAVAAGGPTPPAPAKDKASVAAAQAPTDRFVVKFRDTSTAFRSASARQARLAAAASAFGAEGKVLRRLAVGADAVQLSRKLPAAAAAAFVARLAADPSVQYAHIDHRLYPAYTPNDALYAGSQWHYFDATGGIKLPAAWDLGQGSGIVVAVLDTGIAPHPDLDANIVAGYDFIADLDTAGDGDARDADPADPGDWVIADQCGPGSSPSNSSWHGTHVAGTVAAVTNNSIGVAGVAPLAKVSPVRVLGHCGGLTSDIADAITWASGGTVSGAPANANVAEVINMSLGGLSSCDPTTQAAIDGAVGRGTTIVVAAGNDNTSASDATPAGCNNVITVASNDQTGVRSSFSNAGTAIDVDAPGGSPGIASTLNDGLTVPVNPIYAGYQGTSMASPHVAGLVALMQGRAATTPANIEARLKVTSVPMPGAQCPGGCGYGRVDALAALQTYDGIYPLPRVFWLNNGVNGNVAAGVAGTIRRFYQYTFAGAGTTTWTMAGGTGNLDLYVKFGSPPTTASYNCRSIGPTNAESCVIASPSTGTYYAMVYSRNVTSGATLMQKYTSNQFVNKNDVVVPDNGTADAVLVVHSRPGNAPATLKVNVSIYHSYVGDLALSLVAPDGTIYPLQTHVGGSGDSIITSYTVDASSEPANGVWRLRVSDDAGVDTGHVDEWKLTF